ncbi:MAG: sodium-dependent transporter [Paramuribaculum sp.]|nr:sodium-dependent transporter [Paramuribaculum sp.]
MGDKAQFGSKLGLIAATVGSAVGLGNVWRFPAEAQANGGAAFLIIYIACVFILGVPVMVSEFALGRAGRSDAIGSFKNIGAAKPWWSVGALAICASYMILCFYMVVAGWTIEYLWTSITGSLYDLAAGTSLESSFTQKMQSMIQGSTDPLISTYFVILVNIGVLVVGVQKGIERLSNTLMPVLFLVLIIMCCVSLSLPGAAEGVKDFLSPDFSKINSSVVLNALGQAFFSLSLGMGILITYSSYFPNSTKLTKTALTVSLLDLLVAVMMGLIIFPAIASFNLKDASLEGTTLVFVTLPEVFQMMPWTRLWSVLFFLLLTVAAVTSTISIAEVSVAFVSDWFKISRIKACLVTMLPIFVFSTICSMSLSGDSFLKICGVSVFNFLDNVATNILLPVVSIGVCVYMGWFAPKRIMNDEISNYGSVSSHPAPAIILIIRYVAPLLIALVLISYFMN